MKGTAEDRAYEKRARDLQYARTVLRSTISAAEIIVIKTTIATRQTEHLRRDLSHWHNAPHDKLREAVDILNRLNGEATFLVNILKDAVAECDQ